MAQSLIQTRKIQQLNSYFTEDSLLSFSSKTHKNMICRACLKKLDYRGCAVSLMVSPAAECVSYKLVMLSWQYCCNGFSNH
ncbi:hypothetical protein WN944_027518 [Citrus x changshan-huyou]|uniref:Uncharacterized protein n=1 Tax=Citrus x changshan-huyou TaxID=2935761 RepID=A0AAP0LI36_9ROSI